MSLVSILEIFKIQLKHIKNKGFTLLELMLVVAIMAVLAAIAVPQYQSFADRSKHATVLHALRTIEREVNSFFITKGRYPNDFNEIGIGPLLDPWGSPYQYLNISLQKGKGKLRKDRSLNPVNSFYDLYSMGPDGKSKPPFTVPDSRDDIVRAKDGAFFGRVSEF